MRHTYLVVTVKKWLKSAIERVGPTDRPAGQRAPAETQTVAVRPAGWHDIYESYRKIKTGVSLFGPPCI